MKLIYSIFLIFGVVLSCSCSKKNSTNEHIIPDAKQKPMAGSTVSHSNPTYISLFDYEAENYSEQKVIVNSQLRVGYLAPCPNSIKFKVKIPSHGGLLKFGYGITGSKQSDYYGLIDFTVNLQNTKGELKTIFWDRFRFFTNEQYLKWYDAQVDLSEFKGQEVIFYFNTNDAPLIKSRPLLTYSKFGVPAWSNPRIILKPDDRIETTPKMNVLFLTVDTMRADHLHCYGYERQTSTEIDMLAEEGVLFKNAFSQAPWTFPSYASMFTSLYPSFYQSEFQSVEFIPQEIVTLAEILKNNGYFCKGIAFNAWFNPEKGMTQGFDEFSFMDDDQTNLNYTLEWLEKNHEEPFFLFVHFMAPHCGYSYNEPFAQIFNYPSTNVYFNFFDDINEETLKKYSADEMRFVQVLYDSEIAISSQYTGSVVEKIKNKNLDNNTFVVFVSDHGEEFGDHGGLEHGHTLYDELLHVPLIFRCPSILPRNKVFDMQVRCLDIAPTILDALKMEIPSTFQGISLMPYMLGKTKENDILSFSEALSNGAPLVCFRMDQKKFIYDKQKGTAQLFDLASDPWEKNDIINAINRPVEDLYTHYLTSFKETLKLLSNKKNIYLFAVFKDPTKLEIDFKAKGKLSKLSEAPISDFKGKTLLSPDESSLTITRLDITGKWEAVIQLEPFDANCLLDFSINGKKADPSKIYLGLEKLHPGSNVVNLLDFNIEKKPTIQMPELFEEGIHVLYRSVVNLYLPNDEIKNDLKQMLLKLGYGV